MAAGQKKPKKPLTGFDAFFAEVDAGGSPDTAQGAFDANKVNNLTSPALAAPQPSGFDAFFAAADNGATALDAQRAFDANTTNGISNTNNTFTAGGNVVPPPPPPPVDNTDYAAYRNRNAAQDAAASAAPPITTGATPPPTVIPNLDPAEATRQRNRAQEILDSAISNPNDWDNLDLFISNLGFGMHPTVRAEYADKFRAAQNARKSQTSQVAPELNRQFTPQGQTTQSSPTTTGVTPLESIQNAGAPDGRFAQAVGGSSDMVLRNQQMQLINDSIRKGENFAADAVGGLRDFQITDAGLQFQQPNASSRDVELDRYTPGITGGPDAQYNVSQYEQDLQQALLGRVQNYGQGANSPYAQSLLADVENTAARQREQDVTALNKYGVLNSGDTIDVFAQGNEGTQRSRLAALAQAQQMAGNDGSLEAALGLAQLGSNRDLSIGELTGRFGGIDTLAARNAQAGYTLQGREQDLTAGLANQGSDLSAQRLNLETQLGIADRQLVDADRRSGDERFASQLGLQQLGAQQDLADRVTGRQLIQGDVTSREQFEEDVRKSRVGETQFDNELQNRLDQITTQGRSNVSQIGAQGSNDRLLQSLINSGQLDLTTQQGRNALSQIGASGTNDRLLQNLVNDFQGQLATGKYDGQQTLEGMLANQQFNLNDLLKDETLRGAQIGNDNTSSQIGERQIGQLIALGEALKGNDQLASQLEGINPFQNLEALFNTISSYGTKPNPNPSPVPDPSPVPAPKDNSIAITSIQNQLSEAQAAYRDARRGSNPALASKAQQRVNDLERELKRLQQEV